MGGEYQRWFQTEYGDILCYHRNALARHNPGLLKSSLQMASATIADIQDSHTIGFKSPCLGGRM